MNNLFRFAFLASLALCVLSCSKNAEQFTTNPEDSTVEQAFPNQRGHVHSTSSLNYEVIDGKYVLDGDIILTEQQIRQAKDYRGAGLSDLARRWPNNTIPYTIDPALPNQSRVTNAIAHWEANTNVSLVPRTTEVDYVEFIPSGGCASYLGRIGGKQNIFLASGCSTGSTIHEIGHASGLFHEQARSDRDANVIINWANILSGKEHNFRTYIERGIGGFDNGAFDLGSIMMYGPYSFSNNNQPTITKLDGSTYSVQRTALSSGDIAIINSMYSGGGGTTYTDCAGVTITAGSGSISADINASNINYVKIMDQGWGTVAYLCNSWSNPNCTNGLNTSQNLSAGTYRVQVAYTDGSLCEISSVVVGGTGCTDNDGDGVCQPTDCNDNNASILGPGSPCDDGNPNTTNDILLANCVCQGTTSPPCTDYTSCTGTTISACSGSIELAVAAGNVSYVKIMDANWGTVAYLCNAWSNPNCTNSLNTSENVSAGTYRIQVQYTDGSLCYINDVVVP